MVLVSAVSVSCCLFLLLLRIDSSPAQSTLLFRPPVWSTDAVHLLVNAHGAAAQRCLDASDPVALFDGCRLCVSVNFKQFHCLQELNIAMGLQGSGTCHVGAFLVTTSVANTAPGGAEAMRYYSENSIAGASILVDVLRDKPPPQTHDIGGAGDSGGPLENVLYLQAAPDLPDNAPYDSSTMVGNGTLRRVSLDGDSDELSGGDSRPMAVGIFLRDFKFHGANNRLISWALSLSALGTSVHIYTGCPKYNAERDSNAVFQRLSSVASISIHYHDLFSHQGAIDIATVVTNEGMEVSPEFITVTSAVTKLDAVVVTNCGGEVTTRLFLWMASLGNDLQRPIKLMDMSNIVFHRNPFYSMIDVFLAPSKYAASVATVSKPIAVIYPELDDQFLIEDPCERILNGGAPTEAQPYKFLYVGRLSEEKNPGVFVRAMAKIKETLLTSSAYASRDIKDSIRGIMIGDGPLMGPMRTLVTSLGLGDLIEFTGHLPPKRVNEYMASGDVLVNPRGSGETFGYVHLEAVANGIPVVAFDRGANAESYFYGMLVSELTIEGLEKTLLSVYIEREGSFSRKNVCQNASKVVRSHRPWKQAQAMRRLVELRGMY